MASANVGRGGVPEKSADFWGALQMLFKLSLIKKQIPFVFLLSCSIAGSIMAKVEYAFPVEVIHGKVAKRHKIGFAHRKASKLNYTQSYSKRSTKYSQAEKDHQAKFAAVAAMVNARLADPNQMPLDQLAFKGQSKYETLRKYVWHICSEEYDKQNA